MIEVRSGVGSGVGSGVAHPHATAGGSPRWRGDRGSSLFGTVAGILVFLVFLLFAVQLLVGLYGRSVVSAAAADQARRVAGDRVDHTDPAEREAAEARATAELRAQLGAIGERAVVDWSGSTPDEVVVRVQVDNPRLLFGSFAGPLATDHIDRTVRVRVEAVR